MSEHTPARGRPTLTEDTLAERRDEIASVALCLFLSEGFASVSMRRLGKEVGLTPMALYRYYPSKLDILASLWAYIIGMAFQRVADAVHKADNPIEVLHNASQAYVSYWTENKDHYQLVFMNSGVTNTEVRSFVGERSTIAHFDVFFEAVAKARSTGPLDPLVKIATDGLICHLHGIMHSLITMQGYQWTSAETLVTDAVERSIIQT
jgi:AcrR family transcriptional regulator